jgi:hypothetical protein
MVLADGAAHGKKEEEVAVGKGTPPSIEETICPASNWAASGNLKGVSPPAYRLLQISDWGVGHYYSTWKVEWSTKFEKPKKCQEFYSWVVSRYPDLLAVRAHILQIDVNPLGFR